LATANGGTNLTSFTSGGVVYASSTSALATGSVLSFDGTNLGIGTNSPAAKLHIVSTALPQLRIEYNSSYYTTISNNGTFNIVDASSGNPYVFQRNGTAQATIDTAGYLSGVWADEVYALGNTGTAIGINCTTGNVFTATLTGNCTFTLSNASTTTANTATSFTLILTNDGTAGRTVAWAGGTFKFPGGSVTRTTTANAVDIWFFFSPNGGTTWYGSIPMANLS